MSAAGTPTSRDRRARIGAAAAYLVQGLCFAGLLTRVPSLQTRFGYSDAQLSLILVAVPIVAGVGSVLAGMLASRYGSKVVLRTSGPLVCLAVAGIGWSATQPALFATVGLFGLFVGAVDASMNMQGVTVQRRYGRSLLSSFHGWWSVGGLLGSLNTVALARQGIPLGVGLSVVTVVGLAALAATGWLLYTRAEEHLVTPVTVVDTVGPDGSPSVAAAGPGVPVIPWRPIVLVGLAVMLMYVADSSTSNWSAVYLHKAQHSSLRVAGLGLWSYLVCQMAGRALADRVIARFGPTATVAAGGLVGMAGMLIVVAAPTWLVGVIGFGIVGLGLSVVVPLSFSAAGALDPTGSGVAIARVNLFNYIGFVVGAALIGVVATSTSLRLAFLVPAGLCLLIVVLAPAFRIAIRAASAQLAPSTG